MDLQVDPLHGPHRPIGDLQATDLQHDAHVSTPRHASITPGLACPSAALPSAIPTHSRSASAASRLCRRSPRSLGKNSSDSRKLEWVRQKRAAMTFSRALRLTKSWTFWKVRPMPILAIRYGDQPVISIPLKV